MSFEKLPNELIAKIFLHIVYKPAAGHRRASVVWSGVKEDMPRLRLVCKRFNAIINYELQESLDLKCRFPCFRIGPCFDRCHKGCSRLQDGRSNRLFCLGQCSLFREVASFKHIKFRALFLVNVDFTGCFEKTFTERNSSFSNIDQPD